MRCKLSLLLIFLFTVATAARAQQAQPQQPAQPARPQAGVPAGVRIERDIAYVPDGTPAQRLDLYLPEKPADKPMPLVIWVHGGGWRGGSKAGGARAAFLLPHGYAVASIEYRFSNVALFPAQIQDCQAAVRWLRANAMKYNLDPQRFGAAGDSAGGHLVALMGATGGQKTFPPIGGNEEQSDAIQAVCDFYGPADFTTVAAQAAADTAVKNIFDFAAAKDPYSLLIGGPLTDKAKAQAVSPVHYVGKSSPPILILHGTADALVPYAQSVQLADAYKAAGATAYLQTFPNGGHGGGAFGKPEVRDLIKAFFDKHLKGDDVKFELLPPEQLAAPAPAK
jgi:acetyl esterase/lipase